MRQALSWSDLPALRVGIYGLGREGAASVRACQARGIRPVLVDDAPQTVDVAEPGLAGADVLDAATDGAQALAECDVVIVGPGISTYRPLLDSLRSKGIQVTGGLSLWLAGADRSRVICISGTKGKSTTTAITQHLLSGLGIAARVGGNIGVPPFDPLHEPSQPGTRAEPPLWVIEVSSYQAASLTCAPPQVGITALHPDHLPWHGGDPERYYRDKLSLCSRPGAELTVVNGDSGLLRDRRDLLGPSVQWVSATDDPGATWMDGLALLGAHNRRNALIAQALMCAAGVQAAADHDAMAAAAHGFAGLESRLQQVALIGGVSFVDDGLSTNVLPTLAAVDAFPGRRVALIVGGQDRGIDYRPLAVGLRQRREDLLVITVPDNGPRIHEALLATGAGPAVSVQAVADLAEAVSVGHQWARPGGVVLLSPAAPSFGRFTDYRQRGAAFAAAAAACGPGLAQAADPR
jgi:UDP-N-acetylmuramoyl-L-alanine---L-glutamate ligase